MSILDKMRAYQILYDTCMLKIEALLLKEKDMNVEKAVATLVESLSEDEAYYYSWQANIAMQFKDLVSYGWNMPQLVDSPVTIMTVDKVHELANQAARNFLDLLISQTELSKERAKEELVDVLVTSDFIDKPVKIRLLAGRQEALKEALINLGFKLKEK